MAPTISMALEFSSGSSASSQQMEERENECCTGRFWGLGLEVVPTSHLSEFSHIVSTECHGWAATFWQQFYTMEGEY